MNSLTDLREVVDVVIGVDTHVHTHSAAVVDAAGAEMDQRRRRQVLISTPVCRRLPDGPGHHSGICQ